ncbi:MAG TPA: hypothetical protein VIJ14_06285 [Rhabdochlamydiaceae bacterium]
MIYDAKQVISQVGDMLVKSVSVREMSESDKKLLKSIVSRLTREELANLSFDDLEQSLWEQSGTIIQRIYKEYLELKEQTKAQE